MKSVFVLLGIFLCGIIVGTHLSFLLPLDHAFDPAWWKVLVFVGIASFLFMGIFAEVKDNKSVKSTNEVQPRRR